MGERRADAAGGQSAHELLEPANLLFGLSAREFFGRGKVRGQTFQVEVRAPGQQASNLIETRLVEPKSPHARIKLQMQGPAAILWRSACWREGVRTCCCCGAEVALLFLQPSFEIVKLVHAVEHPGEAKLFEGVLIAARQVSKNAHSAQHA